ncbi:hypothetical protein ACTMU2_26730 [Cupriavidus basilensis]
MSAPLSTPPAARWTWASTSSSTPATKACLDYADYLDYLADDAQTDAVVGYVEGLRDGARFVGAAAAAACGGQAADRAQGR